MRSRGPWQSVLEKWIGQRAIAIMRFDGDAAWRMGASKLAPLPMTLDTKHKATEDCMMPKVDRDAWPLLACRLTSCAVV